MDSKISALSALTSLESTDEFVVVDKSDTSMAASGTDKRVTILEIASYLNPVGTIREFNFSTNPGTLLGFGTWSAFGTGRVTVAIDTGQTEFDTNGETGGAKTNTTSVSGNTSTYTADVPTGGSSGTNKGGTHSHTFSATTPAFSVLQPYIVVYRWVRTA